MAELSCTGCTADEANQLQDLCMQHLETYQRSDGTYEVRIPPTIEEAEKSYRWLGVLIFGLIFSFAYAQFAAVIASI